MSGQGGAPVWVVVAGSGFEDELPRFPPGWCVVGDEWQAGVKWVKKSEGTQVEVLRAVENGNSDVAEVVEKRPRTRSSTG